MLTFKEWIGNNKAQFYVHTENTLLHHKIQSVTRLVDGKFFEVGQTIESIYEADFFGKTQIIGFNRDLIHVLVSVDVTHEKNELMQERKIIAKQINDI